MNAPTTPLRVGAVSYLNTKPLVANLAELAPWAELSFGVPSRLADLLAANRLDVALIPTIEYLQQPSYRLVSDACIACQGPVLSVKLYCRVPASRVRRLSLDAGSRTSAALCQILLRERFGTRPEVVKLPIGADPSEQDADAVLLIGDRAMRDPPGEYAEIWDLGQQWRQSTGLPMVFAMWTARPGVDTSELEWALSAARDWGLAHLDEIAAREAEPAGLTVAECEAYFRESLHFVYGERERAGLSLFARRAANDGFAPAESARRFHDCKTA